MTQIHKPIEAGTARVPSASIRVNKTAPDEKKLVIIAPAEQAEKIVETLQQCPYSQNAAIIGTITEENPGKVIRMTEIGTQSLLPQPGGELLPRIC